MELTVTKSKLIQNPVISSLAFLKSMQVTHYSQSQYHRGASWQLSSVPTSCKQWPAPYALCVWHSLMGHSWGFSDWQDCKRKKGILSIKIILYCNFSQRLQRIFLGRDYFSVWKMICFKWDKTGEVPGLTCSYILKKSYILDLWNTQLRYFYFNP